MDPFRARSPTFVLGDAVNLGHALKLARSARRLSLLQVAERAGLSRSYLSMLETGKRDPTMQTVEKIAGALDVPAPILMFLAAERGELRGLDEDTARRLSSATLNLMRA